MDKYFGDSKKQVILKDGSIFVPFSVTNAESVAINKIPGRVWDGKLKRWTIPLNPYSISKIKEFNWSLSQDIEEWNNKKENKSADLNFRDNLKLYPFQKEGVEMIEALNGRALLADEMGLGKTVQAIAYLKLHPELRPALLIVPASLKSNWQKEINKWIPKERTIIVSSNNTSIKKKDNIIIINYDILNNYIEILEELQFKILVIDEAHMCKNINAIRTRAVRYLGKQIDKIICISGTPITSRPSEFYTTLNLLDNKMFNNHERFLYEYCNKDRDPQAKGSNNPQQLHDILNKSFMIRRLKKDVLKELPPKTISVVLFPIENQEEYNFARTDLISFLKETEGNQAAYRARVAMALVRFEKMKQLAVKGKINFIFEWIDNYIESEKLVIFCTHKSTIKILTERYGDISVKIDGGTPSKKRQGIVEQFQTDDKIKLFIGNIKAAGVGLTLTAASNIAIIELPWTPGDCTQAADRVHRIGQLKGVNVYYLIAENTIEEEIAYIIDKKQKTLDSILNGEETETESLITSLIEKYKNEI